MIGSMLYQEWVGNPPADAADRIYRSWWRHGAVASRTLTHNQRDAMANVFTPIDASFTNFKSSTTSSMELRSTPISGHQGGSLQGNERAVRAGQFRRDQRHQTGLASAVKPHLNAISSLVTFNGKNYQYQTGLAEEKGSGFSPTATSRRGFTCHRRPPGVIANWPACGMDGQNYDRTVK